MSSLDLQTEAVIFDGTHSARFSFHASFTYDCRSTIKDLSMHFMKIELWSSHETSMHGGSHSPDRVLGEEIVDLFRIASGSSRIKLSLRDREQRRKSTITMHCAMKLILERYPMEISDIRLPFAADEIRVTSSLPQCDVIYSFHPDSDMLWKGPYKFIHPRTSLEELLELRSQFVKFTIPDVGEASVSYRSVFPSGSFLSAIKNSNGTDIGEIRGKITFPPNAPMLCQLRGECVLHATKGTITGSPINLLQKSQEPLPPGWEERVSDSGQPLFHYAPSDFITTADPRKRRLLL